MSTAWADPAPANPPATPHRRIHTEPELRQLRDSWVAITMDHLRRGRRKVATGVLKLGVEEQAHAAGLVDVQLPFYPEANIAAAADIWARRTWDAIADRHGLTRRSS